MNGERLSELRKDRGYTQQELAAMLSVSKYTISSYENGKTSPDDGNKILLAQIFNVSLDYLFDLIDVPVSYQRELDEWLRKLPCQLDHEQIEQLTMYVQFLRFCSDKNGSRSGKAQLP